MFDPFRPMPLDSRPASVSAQSHTNNMNSESSNSAMAPRAYGSLDSNSNQNIASDLLEAAAQASAEQESSAESGVEDGSPDNAQKPEKRKKRSRACQACRSMKIRCNPVEGQDACLACSKVNRTCVMPGPARKRQKTVHKVAELEKKINALQQSLLAKTQADPTPQQSPVVTDASHSAKEQTMASPEDKGYPLFPKVDTPQGITPLKPIETDSTYEDVITRGVITTAMAERLFDQFTKEMNPLTPLVSFPRGTDAETVRHARPMTFLAIITSATTYVCPEYYNTLSEEMARQLADRIFFVFERSIDLVQACLIHTTWVGKHRKAKDVGFNQYIHAAIVIAHDLGISKRLKTPLTQDPVEEAELRRTWLACYWCGVCVSTTLRHQPMIRNSPYTMECIEFFKISPAALPGDKVLSALVKIVMIMEDVATCFHMDDPASTVRLDDASTQYSLKAFEKRIDDWRADVWRDVQPGLLNIIHATATLYTHEIALHTDHNVDDFRPPAGRPGSKYDDGNTIKDFITPSHLDALTKCVVAMKSALDTFIAIFPSPAISHLPCLSIVWTAYAAVAMIRLDGALRASKSKYAEIFMPDLKVDYYLDNIIKNLKRSTGGVANCGPVPMFIQAFQKLKVWHQYRLAGGKEYPDAVDPANGLHNVDREMTRFTEGGTGTGTGTGTASSGKGSPAVGRMNSVDDKIANAQIDYPDAPRTQSQSQSQPQQLNQTQTQQQQMAPLPRVTGGIPGSQGFDTHGGSWLTSSSLNMNANANMNVPVPIPNSIDASMFENQDWNFTLEDWNNFEASMVQPAGGSWLGYLL